MMAFSVRIGLMEGSASRVHFDMVWARGWDARKLMADSRFREMPQDLSYQDYLGFLRVHEAQALNAEALVSSPQLHADIAKVAALLESAPKGPHATVLVWVFEWESGL